MGKRNLMNITPNWVQCGHVTEKRRYITMYRDNEKGLQRELVTKRDKDGNPTGNGKYYYFIDGINREFKTEIEMIEHYYHGKGISNVVLALADHVSSDIDTAREYLKSEGFNPDEIEKEGGKKIKDILNKRKSK